MGPGAKTALIVTVVPAASMLAAALGRAIGGGGLTLFPTADQPAGALVLSIGLGIVVTTFLTYQVVKA